MEALRRIMEIACIAADIAAPVGVVTGLYLHGRQKAQGKRSRLPVVLGVGMVLIAIVMNILYFITAVKTYEKRDAHIAELPEIVLHSDNLHNGVWDAVISDTDAGENKSPQLSWEPVEGAGAYAIFMADTDAGNWLHWKTESVTQTELPLGFAGADAYVGPYPPAGQIHTYQIYVAALREADPGMSGTLDAPAGAGEEALLQILASLDHSETITSGNVLAVGRISGTYPAA